jgi:uncharacterized membrane protein YecN with MAPEG domain
VLVSEGRCEFRENVELWTAGLSYQAGRTVMHWGTPHVVLVMGEVEEISGTKCRLIFRFLVCIWELMRCNLLTLLAA